MSTDDVYRRIYDNPKFQSLVKRRGRFAWTLSIVMLAAYYGFVCLIAFDPKLLGQPVSSATVMSWGIPGGLGLIFLCFFLTGIYVQRANGEFDRITREILAEADQ
ncbi:DUF485 domain-containing protein [Asticcacaulis sp. BYS171W]|uniref:DUF485 domain-containing protein n=1 Tax=Asticcacaulis aquaticus TaxID=2984212 RepID=A0ABT5HTJ5_9CAUL|nr:DUF485 domain-containing protein [Asticcacaulis aquaticus]MDC7683304.1 DUF485 domain-containing protein [Asticcacaulis aquaticus]